MLAPLNLFKVLADETRLTVIMLLTRDGELCVCDICDAMTVSQPKISRHMAILRDAGLVMDRREGKWVYYRLSSDLPEWVNEVIHTASQALDQHFLPPIRQDFSDAC